MAIGLFEAGSGLRAISRRRSSATAAGLAAVMLLMVGCGAPRLPSLPEPGQSPEAGRVPSADPADDDRGHSGRDCFQRHLREAIDLNERRSPIYAAWSEGASEPVSRALIRAERQGLLAAWWVDGRARRYQEAGIPIVCADFVSMSLTPPLGPRPSDPPARSYSKGPDPDSVRVALVDAYAEGGFPAVAAVSDSVLHRLEATPTYHCMMRHLVESVWRISALAPRHAAAAESKGLPSTTPLSELLLRLHLAVLEDAHALDRNAAPLQEVGIPIICRDVPPIRDGLS